MRDLAPLLYGAVVVTILWAFLLGPMRRWPPHQRRRGAIVIVSIGVVLGVALGATFG